MILEKDRIEKSKNDRGDLERSLEERIHIGKSAERLLGNLDWQRVANQVKLEIEGLEKNLQAGILGIVAQSDTSLEKDHIACNTIRAIYQVIENRKEIFKKLVDEVESGNAAAEDLRKLRQQGGVA